VLTIFSLLFYTWGEPFYALLLLILSAAVNFAAGIYIERFRGQKGGTVAVTSAVVFNILMLGIFKYSGFFAENINAFFHANLPVPKSHIPVGISFYTFQAISYVIDCHWEKVKVQRHFGRFMLYISFFPKVMNGPITRYADFEERLTNRKATVSDLSYGFNRVTVGLAKKVLIANNLNIIVENLLSSPKESTLIGNWLGIIAFALSMYFDFSGYSDMAIGLGSIFGFRIQENFNYPFICKDITEFWQRWHISLGTFFRDYLLYIPIFGKRRKYGGLFLVWLCTGIWHGASWNFIIWGIYYGLLVFTEMKIGKKKMKKIPAVARHIYTKFAILIGFGIFYFESLPMLGSFFKGIFGFGGNGFINEYDKMTFVNNIWVFALAILFCFPVIPAVKKLLNKAYPIRAAASFAEMWVCAGLLIISSILLVDSTGQMFFYDRF